MSNVTHTTTKQSEPAAPDGSVPEYKGLKITVIVMGVLLVVGFIVVFSTIIYRAVNPSSRDAASRATTPAAQMQQLTTNLSPQAEIKHLSLDRGLLAVQILDQEQTRIIVYDLVKGKELRQVVFSRQR